MDAKYEENYHVQEKKNWWFRARRDFIFKLFQKYRIPKKAAVLDMGCSGGIFLKTLQKKGYQKTTGVDVSKEAIDQCKKKGLKNVFVRDGTQTKFKENAFDVVVASDVLEHIKDDKKALKEWNRILKKGGTLMVFVPAWMFLWDEHDDINHHHRRYTVKELTQKMKRQGFKIKRSSYWNIVIFFPIAIIRTLRKGVKSKKKVDSMYGHNTFINEVLFTLLKVENMFLTLIPFPVGVSCYVIGKKK